MAWNLTCSVIGSSVQENDNSPSIVHRTLQNLNPLHFTDGMESHSLSVLAITKQYRKIC